MPRPQVYDRDAMLDALATALISILRDQDLSRRLGAAGSSGANQLGNAVITSRTNKMMDPAAAFLSRRRNVKAPFAARPNVRRSLMLESWFEDPHANLAKLRGFLNIPDEPEFDLDPAIAGIIDDELRHDDPLLGEARQPLIRWRTSR